MGTNIDRRPPQHSQSGEPEMGTTDDCRNKKWAIVRQNVVNKIVEILKRLLPFAADSEHLLKKSAVRYEENAYATAASRLEYGSILIWQMGKVEETRSFGPFTMAPSNLKRRRVHA